jgi:hypothetical protein
MVPTNERNGDAEESGAAREAVFVIALVAEHEIDPAKSGECAA